MLSKQAGKNSDAGRIKCHWVEKKFPKIYSALFYPHRKVLLFSLTIAEIWTKEQTIKQTN